MFVKGLTKFTKLSMSGSGTTHTALGYFINHDPSNADGYQKAMHFQEIVRSTDGGTFYELTGCVDFKNIDQVSLPGADLTTDAYFGQSPNVLNPQTDSSRNLDALYQANLIKEQDSTSTSKYNIEFTNNYNTRAYIYAFIDLNKDGKFDSTEAANLIIAEPNTKNQKTQLEWTEFEKPEGIYNIRFRITTDVLTDDLSTLIDERAYGLARNGEVTDRYVLVLNEQDYIQTLPVKIVSFEANAINNTAVLKWLTNDESNITSYDIQKSINGSHWNTNWICSSSE